MYRGSHSLKFQAVIVPTTVANWLLFRVWPATAQGGERQKEQEPEWTEPPGFMT